MYNFFVFLFVLSIVSSTPLEQGQDEFQNLTLRLPKNLRPIHYLVKLQPFINGNFSVNGFVELTFDVVESTNRIILHINDIITHNETTKVFSTNGNVEVPILKQTYLADNQFYIITLGESLQKGDSYNVSLNFQGYLNGDLKGFYRASYPDEQGNIKWLATTQFQPTDARRAFPCMDEPGFRSRFTIHIQRENNLTSISNMPLESSEQGNVEGWTVDKFQTSLPMSTYLVAFIVSDFEHRVAQNSSPNYKFAVWTRKGYLDQGDYALKIGPEIMKFYEQFFNVSFPLPKQYMVAVPDMSLGAMENWGLIIYRESRFLYNPKSSTALDKRTTGVIVAHELSHQWFGNLVTPHWWQDLWLNEGFASYMEYVGLDAVEPDFKMMDQTIVGARHSAFSLDCLQSSHPINQPVDDPDEINQIFDDISYDKGSSIIRMMDYFLGRKTMKKGLHEYLTGMSFKVAEQDDLWRYLTDAAHSEGSLPSDLTVKAVMDTWTLQMGYPVLDVKINTNNTITVTQERFLLIENENSTDKHDYNWWIPITYSTNLNASFNQTQPSVWMSPTESSKNIEVAPFDQWIILNNQATGYYRVNYEEKNWNKIVDQLLINHEIINPLNRAQIIDDSLNLARSGRLSYQTAFSILAYLIKEKEYVPLKAGLQNLAYITSMMSHTGEYGRLKNFMLSILSPHYDRIQFTDSLEDPLLEQMLRAQILGWACDLGHEDCIQNSQLLFRQWMANPRNTSLISPNLKDVVYCTAVSNGGIAEWKFVWSQYLNATVSTEKAALLRALACSEDIWILAELLNRTMTTGNGIRKQDVHYVMSAVASSTTGRLVAWNFLRNHWKSFTDFFGSIFFTLDSIIQSVTKSLNTKMQLYEIKAFKIQEKGQFYSAFRSIDQAIENTQNNHKWMSKYYDTIVDWLKTNGYQSGLGDRMN